MFGIQVPDEVDPKVWFEAYLANRSLSTRQDWVILTIARVDSSVLRDEWSPTCMNGYAQRDGDAQGSMEAISTGAPGPNQLPAVETSGLL